MYDDLYKNINTNGQDLGFCVYKLEYENKDEYIGNGRICFGKKGQILLSSRFMDHKDDNFEKFVLSHPNKCTIRIVSAYKTKQQVVALEALLIANEWPPLNKIRGAESYISKYLNI